MAHVNLADDRGAGRRDRSTGRTGGAVSLAVGMAQIFSALPGMSGLLAYWYHFAIMFEALFILTTIDSGTRVARFLLREMWGRFDRRSRAPTGCRARSSTTLIIVWSWGYFIYTGQIDTIWPMFGVANQLLGCVALATASTILIRTGKARLVWVTAAPLAFLAVNTLYGGFLNIRDNFWPRTLSADQQVQTQGYILSVLTAIMIVMALIILGNAVMKWMAAWSGAQAQAKAEG